MKKKVFNLIIVDESGSMSCIEKQALAGMNETLSTIAKMDKMHENMEQLTTLITFDSTHRNFIFDNVPAGKLRQMTAKDYRPCGGTPLYDAIGIGIAKVNALTSADDNVLVTIITDGEENCSEEYNLKMVKNLIEKLKKQDFHLHRHGRPRRGGHRLRHGHRQPPVFQAGRGRHACDVPEGECMPGQVLRMRIHRQYVQRGLLLR